MPLGERRRAALQETLTRTWGAAAARRGVGFGLEPGRRQEDVAFVWLKGERPVVLRLLGRMALREPWRVHVARGAHRAGVYELCAWVSARPGADDDPSRA